jgi:hypothetical protein
MYLAAALVLTGLYNASANKPSELTTKGARTAYRVVYISKILLVLAASPLLDKVVADTVLASQVRLVVVVGGYLVGAWLRFFRKDNMPNLKSA